MTVHPQLPTPAGEYDRYVLLDQGGADGWPNPLHGKGQAVRRFAYVAGAVLPDDSARFDPFDIVATTEDIEPNPSGGGSYTLAVESDHPSEHQFEPSTPSIGGKEVLHPFGLFVPYDEMLTAHETKTYPEPSRTFRYLAKGQGRGRLEDHDRSFSPTGELMMSARSMRCSDGT